MKAVDIEAHDRGSVLSLQPVTAAGISWVAENVHYEPWQDLGGHIAVDHRCGPDILAAALADGLYVTLDGREPREGG